MKIIHRDMKRCQIALRILKIFRTKYRVEAVDVLTLAKTLCLSKQSVREIMDSLCQEGFLTKIFNENQGYYVYIPVMNGNKMVLEEREKEINAFYEHFKYKKWDEKR